MNSFNYSCMRISFIMIILFRAPTGSLGILKFRPYFRILARNSYKLSFKLCFLTDVSSYCESSNFWENSNLNFRQSLRVAYSRLEKVCDSTISEIQSTCIERKSPVTLQQHCFPTEQRSFFALRR